MINLYVCICFTDPQTTELIVRSENFVKIYNIVEPEISIRHSLQKFRYIWNEEVMCINMIDYDYLLIF